MFSVSKGRAKALLAGAAAAAGLAAAGIAHAQAVVVRSTGPSAAQYPQGKRLPANAKVTLRSGDRVTVLDKAGSRVLSGPGSFTLDSAVARDRGAASRVGGVLATGGNTRVRTGAVRGGPVAAQPGASGPDSVWYVDVTKGGHYCIANANAPVLWRPNREQAAKARLTATSGGKSVEVAWPKGSAIKAWPAQLPVVDGAVYTFSDPVGPTVTITTHLLANVPADEVEVAGLLGDRGCLAQLEVLADAASPTASGG